MSWWLIWSLATVGTLVTKFLTARTLERLRHDLKKLQREYAAVRQDTEEARDMYAHLSRQERDKTREIERLQRTIAEMEQKLKTLDAQVEADERETKQRIKPRPL